jgi:hypothetical protein
MTLVLLFLLAAFIATAAVDRSKFRTCQDTGFCRDFRDKSIPTQLSDVVRVRAVFIIRPPWHYLNWRMCLLVHYPAR